MTTECDAARERDFRDRVVTHSPWSIAKSHVRGHAYDRHEEKRIGLGGEEKPTAAKHRVRLALTHVRGRLLAPIITGDRHSLRNESRFRAVVMGRLMRYLPKCSL